MRDRIRQDITLIARTRNLRTWDNWVSERINKVQSDINRLRTFAEHNLKSNSGINTAAMADELQKELNAAITQRKGNQ